MIRSRTQQSLARCNALLGTHWGFHKNASVSKASSTTIKRPVCASRCFSSQSKEQPFLADGMTRYPTCSSAKGVLRGLDYLGTAAFAISGSITAASAGMDLLGCAAVGTITAVGGGTIRDTIFLRKLPFW